MIMNSFSNKQISIISILKLAIPLIIGTSMSNLMFFLDRIILAHYSLEAMNAVAAVTTTIVVFQLSGIGIVASSEMLIGQANGEKNYFKVSAIVWQMLWVSLGLEILFIPIGLYLGYYIIPKPFQNEGIQYFQLIMIFNALPIMIVALSTFYVGRGKLVFPTITLVLSSTLNLILAIIFVHGIKNKVPALGATGAAVATIIAQIFQFSLLLIGFLKPQNKKIYNTHYFKINTSIIKKCFQIGKYTSINYILDILAAAIIFYLLAKSDVEYITVYSIGQSIFILFCCLTFGLERVISISSANLIGLGNEHMIPKILVQTLILHLCIMLILLFPLVIYPEYIVNIFINNDYAHSVLILNITVALKWLWLCFIFEGMRWIISGVLFAGGYTRFLMTIKFIGLFGLVLLPFYILMHYFQVHPNMIWKIITVYTIITLFLLTIKYYKFYGKYHNLSRY